MSNTLRCLSTACLCRHMRDGERWGCPSAGLRGCAQGLACGPSTHHRERGLRPPGMCEMETQYFYSRLAVFYI